MVAATLEALPMRDERYEPKEAETVRASIAKVILNINWVPEACWKFETSETPPSHIRPWDENSVPGKLLTLYKKKFRGQL